MSIRTDITVDWEADPRVITVASPSDELTIQDLVDTCRTLESTIVAMEFDHLLDAAGKEALGGGVFVGVTVTLNNAVVAFEARPGPSFVQCNISGGNLVAVDEFGAIIDPVQTTAYTQVVRTSSSSATLQELQDIQFASFQGGVWYDAVNGTSGQVYPTGTERQPSDNWTDALAIASTRGFNRFYIIGDATVNGGSNFTDHVFEGQGQNLSTLTLNASATLTNCAFSLATINGTLDGESHIRNAIIDSLTFVTGVIENCVLNPSTITLGGSTTAHFIDCESGVPGSGTPVIDCGGSGQPLALRSYSGGVKLINKTGADAVSIDLMAGQVRLDLTTVTNGTIVVRGTGKVVNDANDDWLPSGTYGSLTLVNETVEGTMLQEVWQLQGLDSDNPLTVTPSSRAAGGISQTITGDGETSTTVTRT